MNRRTFLQAAAGCGALPLDRLAAQDRGKIKITDVQCMIVRGTWDWNLIRVKTDSGLYGLGEAYWGYGVKDLVLNQLKPLVLGEDPLNVDKLYHKMLLRSAGAGALAGVTMTAASGIEIALWDLAGRILETPVCNLLGGRFRDRIRFYRTLQTVDDVEDMGAWRAQVQAARAEKFGWTAFKFQGDGIPPRADPEYREPGHDPYTRGLTLKDLRRIATAMETVRDELGPDIDFGVEAHWKYDVRDAIQMAQAIAPAKPMWLEDPVPPGNPDAMAHVTHASHVPIATGENLYGRDGFRRLIEIRGCDVVHIDIPKSGGLLESKRIHDLADGHYIWTAAHNPASPLGTIASCHAASSMRDFRVHELAKYIDWWQDLVIHDGPIFENGYYRIRDKPGYGVELNPDVAKAHLAPREPGWGEWAGAAARLRAVPPDAILGASTRLMDPLQLLAKHVLDPIEAFREGSDHRRVLRELERSQYLPADELKRLQAERLRAMLIHAARNCPFYAERFQAAGVAPERDDPFAALEALPVLTKSDIQKNRDRMIAANYDQDQLVPNQTGGSTGAPLRFLLNRERFFSRKAATMRHDRWAGLEIGCKLGVLWGAHRDFLPAPGMKERLRRRFYSRRLTLDTSEVSSAKLKEFVVALRRFAPPVYLAYANSVFLLARYLRSGAVKDYHRPKSIITSAELLGEEQREVIEGVFECPVFDRYGCRETSVIASECERHAGMHLCAETLFVEIQKDRDPADSNQAGPILITDLLNFGMPLIRYRVEDVGRFEAGPCDCGRTLPLMRIAGGRTTDFLVKPDGGVVSGAAMTIYFIATTPGIAQAQLVQERREHLTIRVVKGEDFDDSTIRIIGEKVKKFFGDSMKFEIDFVDSIPSTASGKHRFSISKLDPMEFLT